MAELRTIARPYAEAAFSLAQEEKALAHWSESLAALARVACSPDLSALMGNPAVPPARLADIVASAVSSLFSESVAVSREFLIPDLTPRLDLEKFPESRVLLTLCPPYLACFLSHTARCLE
jgi:F-type H+-transporting ATPase subunit delta